MIFGYLVTMKSGIYDGKIFPIYGTMFLGRDRSSDIPIQNEAVALNQCRLDTNATYREVRLFDISNHFPTFLNGQPFNDGVVLQPDDEISFCGRCYVFKDENYNRFAGNCAACQRGDFANCPNRVGTISVTADARVNKGKLIGKDHQNLNSLQVNYNCEIKLTDPFFYVYLCHPGPKAAVAKLKHEIRRVLKLPREVEEAETTNPADCEKERGNEAFRRKDYATALKHYDNAISIAGGLDASLCSNKAAALHLLEKYDLCIEQCWKGLGCPGLSLALSSKIYSQMGRAFEAQHNFADALRAYERCNSSVEIKRKLAELRQKLSLQPASSVDVGRLAAAGDLRRVDADSHSVAPPPLVPAGSVAGPQASLGGMGRGKRQRPIENASGAVLASGVGLTGAAKATQASNTALLASASGPVFGAGVPDVGTGTLKAESSPAADQPLSVRRDAMSVSVAPPPPVRAGGIAGATAMASGTGRGKRTPHNQRASGDAIGSGVNVNESIGTTRYAAAGPERGDPSPATVGRTDPAAKAEKAPLADVFAITPVGEWSAEVEQHEEQLRRDEAEGETAKAMALVSPLQALNIATVSKKPSGSRASAGSADKGGTISLPSNILVSSGAAKAPEVKSRPSDVAETLRVAMEDLGRLEHQLHLLAMDYSQHDIPEDTSKLVQLRGEIQQKYCSLLLSERFLESVFNQQLDANLWKDVYYEMIEAIRRLMDKIGPSADKARGFLLKFIDEAISFYHRILEQFERTYGFQFSDFLRLLNDTLAPPLRPFAVADTPVVQLALSIAHRLMIAVGDLERYKALASKSTAYGCSLSWYMKAYQLCPSNGRPYNQLALLAIYTNRRTDAVYFLVRSLAAAFPFEKAREQLISTFADVQRKFAQFEKELGCELEQEVKKQGQRERTSSEVRSRVEIWTRPDGSDDPRHCVAEEPLTHLDLLRQAKTDLLHRRMTVYLLQLGNMFIQDKDPEMLDGVARKVIVQLRELLSRTQSPLTAVELVKFVTVAMYCVHNSTPSTASASDVPTPSLLRQCALQFLFSLFGILLESLSKILAPVQTSAQLNARLQEDGRLSLILPALRVIANWIMLSRASYAVGTPTSDGTRTYQIDAFALQTLASICNRLKEPEIASGRIVTVVAGRVALSGSTNAFVIPEDSFLAGFSRLFPSPSPMLAGKGVNLMAACQSHRLNTLTDLSDFLARLRLNNATPAPSDIHTPQAAVVVGEQRQSEHQERELLSQVGSTNQSCLEVVPSILVPDTCSFIDHLPLLKQILESTKYWLYVGSPVKVELEGLTKRKDSDWLPKMAREALRFLSQTAATGKFKLKGITTQGDVVDDLRSLSEDFAGPIPCDRILLCCEQIMETSDQQQVAVDGRQSAESLRFRRNVVLLTEDRNLQYKALLMALPTKTAPQFVEWAGLSAS